MLFLFIGILPVSAQKYATKTGSLKFEASVESFEEVAAENKNTSAILESSTGEIAVLTLMKGFRFKIALMEEHFNENYVESDKFPKATFKGKVEDFDASKLSSTAKIFKISASGFPENSCRDFVRRFCNFPWPNSTRLPKLCRYISSI